LVFRTQRGATRCKEKRKGAFVIEQVYLLCKNNKHKTIIFCKDEMPLCFVGQVDNEVEKEWVVATSSEWQ
jgi:hypothetical protein